MKLLKVAGSGVKVMLVKEELWNNFLNIAKKEINTLSYNTWFTDLKLLKVDNNEITLQVPMDVHKTILEMHYYSFFEETLLKITGINYNIKFVLPNEYTIYEDDNNNNNNVQINQNDDIEKLDFHESNLKKELNFENYIVGNSNRFAKAACMSVAESPGKINNPLFIYGKSGLGKTHLMHAIGNFIEDNTNLKVLYTTSDMFMNEYAGIAGVEKGKKTIDYSNKFKNKYRNIDVLIIDDIQYLVGADKTQEEFFYTFNYLHQANKQIIISSDRSPDDLKKIEERLRSRFMWGLPVNIDPPDFDLRVRIIKQKLKGKSIEKMIDEDVINYIANSCQNDIRFLEGTINRLMAYTAMIVPDKINLEFAYEALKDYLNTNVYSNSSIENIQKAVADYYHITVDDLKGKKRSNKIAYPRQIGMYLCRVLTDETISRIGLEFGGRDHSTVIYASEKITEDLKNNKELGNIINSIKSQF